MLPGEFLLKTERPIIPEKLELDRKFSQLGKGEKESIAWSLQAEALLATDDKKAREVAKNHGISFIGTIGLVRLAFERDYFPDLITYHSTVDALAKDLYLSPELIAWAKRT